MSQRRGASSVTSTRAQAGAPARTFPPSTCPGRSDVARAPFREEYVQGVKARILARLAAARGAVVPHDVLALAAYGDRGPDDAAGVIRQLVYRLRKRLPPGSLTTVWGRG